MAKRKICSYCGEPFECASPQGGCWCESIALDRETLAVLRERYTDCLCPRCLKEFAGRGFE